MYLAKINSEKEVVESKNISIFARTKKSRVYEVASVWTLASERDSIGGHEAVSSVV
jgi:hypothetical protein